MATVKLDVLTVAMKVKKQTVIYIEYFSRQVQFYNSVSSSSSISSTVDTERLLVTYQRIVGTLGWIGYQNATAQTRSFSVSMMVPEGMFSISSTYSFSAVTAIVAVFVQSTWRDKQACLAYNEYPRKRKDGCDLVQSGGFSWALL